MEGNYGECLVLNFGLIHLLIDDCHKGAKAERINKFCFMKNIPSKNVIVKLILPNEWDFGNKILYDLCKEYFKHNDKKKVIAKVWLIGRAYSAAIERRKNKKPGEDNDQFYIKKVSPTLINSELDEILRFLSGIDSIREDNIIDILKSHKYLQSVLQQITKLEKRSFCSKYLHFHLPNLFFIYDSRAVQKIRNFSIKIPARFNQVLNSEHVDIKYAKYYIKCFLLIKEINLKTNLRLSPRQLDNLIVFDNISALAR